MEVELTTMCCLIDKQKNQVLMIKREKTWKGMAFPGGHLENHEGITSCVIREIREETGLNIKNVQYKGNVFFFNTENKKKHIIWNYICEEFEGELKQYCNEGELMWVGVDELFQMPLAEGMELRFDLFLQPGIFELYVEWDIMRGYTSVNKIKIG